MISHDTTCQYDITHNATGGIAIAEVMTNDTVDILSEVIKLHFIG
jgi:hypothetical protein